MSAGYLLKGGIWDNFSFIGDFHYDTHSIIIQCIPFVPQEISLNPSFV